MRSLKRLIRRLLPGWLRRLVEQTYRILRGLLAQIIYGWPTRDMIFIMITGTNGKTTVAHFLFQILRSGGHKVGMSTTTDFQINDKKIINDTNMTVVDPFRLRRQLRNMRRAGVEYVILEATSQALDQKRLFGIPTHVAVMTNLTQDHLDYHGTMENYARAKARLFSRRIISAVLNADDEWYKYFRSVAGIRPVLSYGRSGEMKLLEYKEAKGRREFNFTYDNQTFSANLPLSGEYNAMNALAALAASWQLGMDLAAAAKSLAQTPQIDGRMEQVRAGQKFQVIVDYAHTPDGLEKVLSACRNLTSGKLWLVFGSCGDRDKIKRPIMGEIAARLADKIVVTDEEPYSEDPAQIREQVIAGISKKSKMMEIADRRKAMKYAFEHATPKDLVLITGLGHEQYRVFADHKQKWNDIDEAKKLIDKMY